jgi:Putative prokaryotic signal transducing protein
MQQDHTIIFHIFDDILEANIAQEKLNANGIDSFLENENVMGLNPLGGIELKIFSKDKEAAEKILAE